MATIERRSPAINDDAPIPAHHSKDGGNVSPALEWSGRPDGTAHSPFVRAFPVIVGVLGIVPAEPARARH